MVRTDEEAIRRISEVKKTLLARRREKLEKSCYNSWMSY